MPYSTLTVGIDAQVYYILKDKFMTHALSSELLINSSYDDHVLSWRNRNPARPVLYSHLFLPILTYLRFLLFG